MNILKLFQVELICNMPKFCRLCKKRTHKIGDGILCRECTINQYQTQKGDTYKCKSGRQCLNTTSALASRKWLPSGIGNYQIRRDSTMVFHQYCHACYSNWHYKVHQSEKILEENQQLKAQLEAQAEEIAQLQRTLEAKNRLFEILFTKGYNDYQLLVINKLD